MDGWMDTLGRTLIGMPAVVGAGKLQLLNIGTGSGGKGGQGGGAANEVGGTGYLAEAVLGVKPGTCLHVVNVRGTWANGPAQTPQATQCGCEEHGRRPPH
eukprot:364201-Chlamydomonas_euryale.AAC.6